MRVTAIQFVPLGRPLAVGDYVVSESGGYEGSFLRVLDAEHLHWLTEGGPKRDTTAHERREVDVEVDDDEPAWMKAAAENAHHKAWAFFTVGEQHVVNCIARAFKTAVEKRARLATHRIVSGGEGDVETVVREEMLRG